MINKIIPHQGIALFFLGAVMFLTFMAMMNGVRFASASAPSGLPATWVSEAAYTVSTTALQIAATSTCAARIVSTSASPVQLGFSAAAGSTTSATVGTLQAASTTVVYDSGIYGCGQLSAYSFTSGTVNVVETR